MIHAVPEIAQAERAQWPYCPALGGTCLVHEAVETLGNNIYESLMTFIHEAKPGGRLILQKNRGDFSIQVTGPVEREDKGRPDLSRLRVLRKKLDDLDLRVGEE